MQGVGHAAHPKREQMEQLSLLIKEAETYYVFIHITIVTTGV